MKRLFVFINLGESWVAKQYDGERLSGYSFVVMATEQEVRESLDRLNKR